MSYRAALLYRSVPVCLSSPFHCSSHFLSLLCTRTEKPAVHPQATIDTPYQCIITCSCQYTMKRQVRARHLRLQFGFFKYEIRERPA